MSNIALKTTIQDIENEYNLKVANIDKTLKPLFLLALFTQCALKRFCSKALHRFPDVGKMVTKKNP